MKYSLRSTAHKDELKKVEEVRFRLNEIKPLLDLNYIEDPDLRHLNIVIAIDTVGDETFDTLKKLKILYGDRLTLCIYNFKFIEECKALNIPFYFGYTITSYEELQIWINAGACCFILGGHLFFELADIKRYYNISVRAICNLAGTYPLALPKNGLVGTWIRPEDIDAYEGYIDIVEFYAETAEKEKTLLKIYSEQKTWPGELNMIISGVSSNAISKAISADFGKIRLNCHQSCLRNKVCNLCERSCYFASKDFYNNVLRAPKE